METKTLDKVLSANSRNVNAGYMALAKWLTIGQLIKMAERKEIKPVEDEPWYSKI